MDSAPLLTHQLESDLAAVSGIITPSKIPPGQHAYTSPTTSPNNNSSGAKVCIVCGSNTPPERVKEHFVACMRANGNPMGAHWFHNFVDAPKVDVDESYHSDELLISSPNASTLASTPQAFVGNNPNYTPNRAPIPNSSTSTPTPLTHTFAPAQLAYIHPSSTPNPPLTSAARLAAVNGIISPSKVTPGESPSQGHNPPTNQDLRRNKFKCAICARLFNSRSTVRAHFPVCVERNGNPEGRRWDGCSEEGRRSIAPKQSEESVPGDPESNVNASRGSFQQDATQPPQSTPIPTDQPAPLLGPPTAPTTMEERELAMGKLTNARLLDMLQAWQSVISSGQEDYARADIGFQDVMTELEERRLVDREWKWTIDDARVVKTYVRME